MRSSQQKLKLLGSLGSRPNGTSASTRQHPSDRRTTSPGTPTNHRPLRNNNHRQPPKPQQLVSGSFRGNSTSTISVASLRTVAREISVLDETENAVSLPRMDTVGLTPEVRAKAFNICRDYLHGAWKQIDLRDLVIKRVR